LVAQADNVRETDPRSALLFVIAARRIYDGADIHAT
jgi:hypothetical protein